jgi:hypothetical protein
MAFKNPFAHMSKPEIYATVAGGTAITGYLVIHHHSTTGSWNPWSSTTASTASTTAAAVDPVTGLPSSEDDTIDPLTGQTYLAEATQYGSVATAEASVSAFGASTATGSGIPVNPASPVAVGSPNPVVGTSVYTSNAAWGQAVQAGLVSVGYASTAVADAIGNYLTAQPLSTTGSPSQVQIINTGIAEYGDAPVGNLQIITAPASQPSLNTGTVTVTNVVNMTADQAEAALRAEGLVPDITLAASSDKPGISHIITKSSPAVGSRVAPGTRIILYYKDEGTAKK